MSQNKPDALIFAAAKVGGIHANEAFPADFIYDNLAIETNVIHAAHRAGVERLVFLGSSCIYPKFAPQPIKEEHLLTGPLEPTNQWYAIAKIAGIKLCQTYRKQHGRRYISVMPCNLYGPRDNFDLMRAMFCPPSSGSSMKRKPRASERSPCGARESLCASFCTSTIWREESSSVWTTTTNMGTLTAAPARRCRSARWRRSSQT